MKNFKYSVPIFLVELTFYGRMDTGYSQKRSRLLCICYQFFEMRVHSLPMKHESSVWLFCKLFSPHGECCPLVVENIYSSKISLHTAKQTLDVETLKATIRTQSIVASRGIESNSISEANPSFHESMRRILS